MSNRYAAYERLRFDRPAEGVLRISMVNPQNRANAADERMHSELCEIWRDIDKDPEVGAVILRGTETAFSAGAEFAVIEKIVADQNYRLKLWKEARDIVYNVINCGKPTIAAMNGPAVGAGLAAGMVCDITIAAKSARIIDGHTRLGVAAGDHAAIVWPLLCGLAKSKYHLLLCEPVSGEEAERIGLVSLCVDDDKVQDKALEVAEKLVKGSPTAIRWTKYALNNWLRMAGPTFDASLAMEFMGFGGPEVVEGRQAIVEKRKPKFPPSAPY